MDRKKFIEALAPHVQMVRKEGSPLFPSVRLAQNILETGCNINSHYNLAGYKIGSGKVNQWWRGATYTTPTWEVIKGVKISTVATWRSYDTLYDFYKDQDLLFQNPRYDRVRAAKTPNDQARMLQACGYATDPQYADKLIALIVANGLSKYDEEAKPKMDPIKANKIIDDYIRPGRAAALKVGDKAKAEEAYQLANELRKASGQPVQ